MRLLLTTDMVVIVIKEDRSAKLWGYLGFLHTENGDDAKVIRAFRKTADLSPHSERASLGLFHSLWRAGRTDGAFDEMRRFMKSNDSSAYRALLRDMLSESPTRKEHLLGHQ